MIGNTGNQSRIEQRKIRKTKTRRGKILRNTIKHFTIFYQNIKIIKSKLDSLTETVDDTNPTVTCIFETNMLKEEEITIPG